MMIKTALVSMTFSPRNSRPCRQAMIRFRTLVNTISRGDTHIRTAHKQKQADLKRPRLPAGIPYMSENVL
jgi:hypothetical protein